MWDTLAAKMQSELPESHGVGREIPKRELWVGHESAAPCVIPGPEMFEWMNGERHILCSADIS